MKATLQALTTVVEVRLSLEIGPLVERIKSNGYTPHTPIYVYMGEDDIFVIDGNRRIQALRHIQDTDPELFEEILPRGVIHVIPVAGDSLEDAKLNLFT